MMPYEYKSLLNEAPVSFYAFAFSDLCVCGHYPRKRWMLFHCLIADASNPWMDSDHDYTYDELLQRAFANIMERNPGGRNGPKTFVMRPPQVMRVGTRKTAFVNFHEMATMLHRQPSHLLAFFFAELGTSGSIDGNHQLILKGRFQQNNIENVLRRYIKEYVMCHACRSPDTILSKETRLFFLQCMTCHSRCTVENIKTGFQAVTGRRSANRNKTYLLGKPN